MPAKLITALIIFMSLSAFAEPLEPAKAHQVCKWLEPFYTAGFEDGYADKPLLTSYRSTYEKYMGSFDHIAVENAVYSAYVKGYREAEKVRESGLEADAEFVKSRIDKVFNNCMDIMTSY